MPDTLCVALRDHAARSRATVTFPATGVELYPAGWLDGSARLARGLVGAGVRPGEVVGLLVPTGPWFPVGLFAVGMAGAAASVLPVRAWSADWAGQAAHLARIVDVARIRHLVADPGYEPLVGALLRLRPDLVVLAPAATGRPTGSLPEVDPDDLALVQFTSGSTNAPKGVCLSHRAVLAGLRAVVESSAVTEGDVFVQWVPHHHDMGLVTPLAYALAGADVHLFDPLSFIARPERVVAYLAERGGTAFTGPNFAYDLLVDTVSPDTVAGLDLRRWRLAYNGAEPVQARTVDRFAAHFAPAGVTPGVMFPAYGLAEATVAVSAPPPGTAARVAHLDRHRLADAGTAATVAPGHPSAKPVVSMGRPVPGIAVRLVDPAGLPCPAGRLGEVQISGTPVTSGYLHDSAATRAATDGAWLRTGDLGFQLDGELYVTGRRDDMVVVCGQNFFCEDIEAVAGAVPGVLDRRALAVTGADRVVVTVEAAADPAAAALLGRRIRHRVTSALGLGAVQVRVLAPGALPRTANGKWRRSQLRADTSLPAAPPPGTPVNQVSEGNTHDEHHAQALAGRAGQRDP